MKRGAVQDLHVYQVTASPSDADGQLMSQPPEDGGVDDGSVVPDTLTENLSSEALARANAYTVLAALLVKPPTNELLQAILPTAASLSGVTGDIADGWRSLASVAFRQSSEADVSDSVFSDAQLDDEYHAVLIGVVRGEVMPYGSWYMSGFLMDKPLAALRQDLKSLGFERAKGVSEPEDHAGALCETMAMMIQSPDVSERAEKTFFERHMRPWMNLFFVDMTRAKSAAFYLGVGEFGQRFISFEKDYFDMAI